MGAAAPIRLRECRFHPLYDSSSNGSGNKPKRFDIFSPGWGMLRRSGGVQIFI